MYGFSFEHMSAIGHPLRIRPWVCLPALALALGIRFGFRYVIRLPASLFVPLGKH